MLKKAFLTNSGGTLFSRVLGYFRDVMMAGVLGANIYSDIFFVAFKFPNLFRRVVSEGAFSSSFIPSLTAATKKAAFSYVLFVRFCIGLFIFASIVTLFPQLFTKLIAYGFEDSEIELAAPYVAINFWYLPLIFITTFFATILQYKNHFLALSFFPALLNVGIIAALLLSFNSTPQNTVLNLSLGVIGGGVLQVLFVLYLSSNHGVLKVISVGRKSANKNKKHLKTDLNRFYKQFLPSLLGSSTAQVASFIDTLLASFLVSGAISYLYYANRIFQLPLAIFALALSAAIFPSIARLIKNRREKEALASMKRGFWFLLITLSLFSVGGIMLSNEIIWLLFERGEFMKEDSLKTALVLQAYMVGLIPFGIAKLFSLWLFSEGRQVETAKISAISLGFNIIFSLLLILPFKEVGLALAGSLGGVVLLLLTIRAFGIKRFFFIIKDKRVVILIIAVIFESGVLYVLKESYVYFRF